MTARSQWATRFTNSWTGALTTAERLALPGAAARVVWITGDATLERIACIDWTHRTALVDTVAPYQSMRELVTASEEGVPPEEEVIIAIAELITYLALASASADAWRGRPMLYTGDNMNVHQWLEQRAAGNALARWLLRIFGAPEATHSFQTISAYFRTYHNVTADSLTRDKCEEVDELQRHGLELLDASMPNPTGGCMWTGTGPAGCWPGTGKIRETTKSPCSWPSVDRGPPYPQPRRPCLPHGRVRGSTFQSGGRLWAPMLSQRLAKESMAPSSL